MLSQLKEKERVKKKKGKSRFSRSDVRSQLHKNCTAEMKTRSVKCLLRKAAKTAGFAGAAIAFHSIDASQKVECQVAAGRMLSLLKGERE